MLRLTLRSGHDGRLLARIVDRDGIAFVLDYGDPEVVADASRRVHHGGFAVRWQGALEQASAGAPGLLRQLALHYAALGYLVFVDEPTWPRRAGVAPEDAPSLPSSGPPTLLPDDPSDVGEETEILSRRDLELALARHEAQVPRRPPAAVVPLEPVPLPDLPPEDEVTEQIDDDDTVELGRR